MERYEIDGFIFTQQSQWELAKQEKEAIGYLEKQMDKTQIKSMVTIYCQMVERKLFQTPVGYAYLKNLQNQLQQMPQLQNVDLPAIVVVSEESEIVPKQDFEKEEHNIGKEKHKKNIDIRDNKKHKLSKRERGLVLICAILGICIAIMLGIASTSNSPTILNYEEELVNKYSQWETELVEREADLIRREKELQ